MKNLTTSKNAIGLNLASVLAFKKSATVAQATKTITPIYYIEDCEIHDDSILVVYTLNDEWNQAVVSMAALRSFAVTVGLNDYCFDYSANGEHHQDAGSLDLDTFIAENLNASVKAYLMAKRTGQNVN